MNGFSFQRIFSRFYKRGKNDFSLTFFKDSFNSKLIEDEDDFETTFLKDNFGSTFLKDSFGSTFSIDNFGSTFLKDNFGSTFSIDNFGSTFPKGGKGRFEPFLQEGTHNDSLELAELRNDKLLQFYFKEFLYYQAGITSVFWCCPFGKQILETMETRDPDKDFKFDSYFDFYFNYNYDFHFDEIIVA